MTLRALIVDDEPPARKRLKHLLKSDARVTVAGEAGNGLDALAFIETHRPDLVFLDIQMPKMTGFELLDGFKSKRPLIIFTTAYDQYAIKAFEVNAIDYLLKPFDGERLELAVTRAVDRRNFAADANMKIDRLLEEIRQSSSFLRRLLIYEGDRRILVRLDDVVRIEAAEKYVRLFTASSDHLHRESIHALEKKLHPDEFARVHRSHIVRLDSIKEVASWSRGESVVILKNGGRIPVGRRFKDSFFRKLGQG